MWGGSSTAFRGDFPKFITNQILSAGGSGDHRAELVADKPRESEDPFDLVIVEIEAALANGMPVVPVLLGGRVEVPFEAQLPDTTGKLTYMSGTMVNPRPASVTFPVTVTSALVSAQSGRRKNSGRNRSGVSGAARDGAGPRSRGGGQRALE